MLGAVSSNWLTSIRLRRLDQALQIIPSRTRMARRTDVMRCIWRSCGGPSDEITILLTLLERLVLLTTKDEFIGRSAAGDKVAKASIGGNSRPFALTLLRAGCFHDQARLLIESGRVDSNGNLECSTKTARTVAPQLLGLLRYWPTVRVLPVVQIPKELITELSTIWALLPPVAQVPSWALERKAVGDRAEMYTVQWERTRATDASKIIWVARDADDLGWDVEDRSINPSRYIEVKGRRDNQMIFFISKQEWTKAHEMPLQYEIHFWGGIDLTRDPAHEYASLTAAGYPLILMNLPAQLAVGTWHAVPDRWRVSIAESTP